MLDWTKAPTFPRIMERAARIQRTQNRPGALMAKTTRSKTAKAAAFGAVDINPTTGAGAPSYTSGLQMWKGAAETLNPKPTNIKDMATNTRSSTGPAGSFCAMISMLVDPVAPNMSATPYRKKAVAKEPSKKYLSEASLLEASLRRNPARM